MQEWEKNIRKREIEKIVKNGRKGKMRKSDTRKERKRRR